MSKKTSQYCVRTFKSFDFFQNRRRYLLILVLAAAGGAELEAVGVLQAGAEYAGYGGDDAHSLSGEISLVGGQHQ